MNRYRWTITTPIKKIVFCTPENNRGFSIGIEHCDIRLPLPQPVTVMGSTLTCPESMRIYSQDGPAVKAHIFPKRVLQVVDASDMTEYMRISMEKITDTGRVTKEYKIQPKNIGDDDIVIDFQEDDLTYTGTMVNRHVESIQYGKNTLKILKDYTVSGTQSATEVNAGGYELVIEGVGNYTGTVKKNWYVEPKNIAEAVITFESQFTYSGAEQSVEYTVELDGKVLEESKDYIVTDGEKGTNAGSYSLKLKGTGNYEGECKGKWNILPKDGPEP